MIWNLKLYVQLHKVMHHVAETQGTRFPAVPVEWLFGNAMTINAKTSDSLAGFWAACLQLTSPWSHVVSVHCYKK